MPREREYDFGHCEQCGSSMKLKPTNRRFCKKQCRYYHNNHKLPRATYDAAILVIEEYLMTVADAVKVSGVAETTLRRMVKQGRLRSKRLFGRVLVYRSQVEAMKRSAADVGVTSAAAELMPARGKGMAEATANDSMPGATIGNRMPVEVNAASYDVS